MFFCRDKTRRQKLFLSVLLYQALNSYLGGTGTEIGGRRPSYECGEADLSAEGGTAAVVERRRDS